MTTQHPEALRLADELDAVPETGADPQTIQEAAAELRRQHARIAELEARIKTMAEEHADELMVAHLDGRMRAEQAIPGVQWQCGPQANGFTAPQADSQPAADEIISMAREQGLPETEIEGVFRVNVDDLGRMFAADRAARAPADSVLEDAARLDWLLLHISGAEFRRIGVHYSGNASRADVDAARKQGANHD